MNFILNNNIYIYMRVLQRAAVSLSPFHTTYAAVTKQRLRAGTATQPFLVSSRNVPPHKERCVTTQKTAVLQTREQKGLKKAV